MASGPRPAKVGDWADIPKTAKADDWVDIPKTAKSDTVKSWVDAAGWRYEMPASPLLQPQSPNTAKVDDWVDVSSPGRGGKPNPPKLTTDTSNRPGFFRTLWDNSVLNLPQSIPAFGDILKRGGEMKQSFDGLKQITPEMWAAHDARIKAIKQTGRPTRPEEFIGPPAGSSPQDEASFGEIAGTMASGPLNTAILGAAGGLAAKGISSVRSAAAAKEAAKNAPKVRTPSKKELARRTDVVLNNYQPIDPYNKPASGSATEGGIPLGNRTPYLRREPPGPPPSPPGMNNEYRPIKPGAPYPSPRVPFDKPFVNPEIEVSEAAQNYVRDTPVFPPSPKPSPSIIPRDPYAKPFVNPPYEPFTGRSAAMEAAKREAPSGVEAPAARLATDPAPPDSYAKPAAPATPAASTHPILRTPESMSAAEKLRDALAEDGPAGEGIIRNPNRSVVHHDITANNRIDNIVRHLRDKGYTADKLNGMSAREWDIMASEALASGPSELTINPATGRRVSKYKPVDLSGDSVAKIKAKFNGAIPNPAKAKK